MSGIQILRSGRLQSPVEESLTSAVSCLCHEALSEWHLGEIASCQATMAEAIALGKELNDLLGLAQALWFAAVLAQYERNPAEVKRYSLDLMEPSTRHSLGHWLIAGKALSGWARSASGDIPEGICWVDEGILDYRTTGAVLVMPYILTLKAEALRLAGQTSEALEAINEAEALAERSEERWWNAESHRLHGVFLAVSGAEENQIEASFCTAIRIATEQKSVSLRKRSEATYAEYHRQKASGSGGREIQLPL